jgi:uncharacterized protein
MDLPAFTPGPALLGGLLIGLAAGLLLALTGRIAGIAGLLGTAWQSLRALSWQGQSLRWTFVMGLLAAPWAWQAFAPLPTLQSVAGLPMTLLAGVLVGVGVRLGNGCTSGHGVCGLARGSVRSLANVLSFMAAGFATVAVLRGLGWLA